MCIRDRETARLRGRLDTLGDPLVWKTRLRELEAEHERVEFELEALTAALDELAECVAGRDNVEQIIEARELSHAVNAFLHTLSRNDRIIFTARYYLALPAPAIAERLGCREGRVHTSLCRSRKKLRDYLIKEELL